MREQRAPLATCRLPRIIIIYISLFFESFTIPASLPLTVCLFSLFHIWFNSVISYCVHFITVSETEVDLLFRHELCLLFLICHIFLTDPCKPVGQQTKKNDCLIAKALPCSLWKVNFCYVSNTKQIKLRFYNTLTYEFQRHWAFFKDIQQRIFFTTQ